MKNSLKAKLCRRLRDEKGAALVYVALMMTILVGFAGLAIDTGQLFYCHRELQAATDAAALAGAEDLPNATAITTAASFSAMHGMKNANANLGTVQMVSGYPKAVCLTTLTNMGMSCVAPMNANAMQVQQTAAIRPFFMGVVGISTLNITASATASMQGSAAVPYNVAIVLDATASMASTDSKCSNLTRLECAKRGVQTLLGKLYACTSSYATCPTDGTNSVDRVSLFTYPNITVGTQNKEYCAASGAPNIPVYSFPVAGASSYAPSGSTTATYQVVNWTNDFRTSDTTSGTTTLNSASNFIKAVNGNTKFGGSGSSCGGMQDPGGQGTFFAGAIYAAQSALVAEQALHPDSQNALIVLSDGDANSKYYTTPKQHGNSSSSGTSQMASTDVNGTAITGSGTYPSYNNQCAQAVTAASAARTAGTKVFTVAYGAANSGCSTDSPAISPCTAMQNMASPGGFYSDTCSFAASATTIDQIFADIASSFTVARLIPDDVN
ncbi:MAG TPA: pilus assembly protein TadG-related protein [Terracidiphilus sp.]|jgi:Flp pilus assembly protein TadG